MLLRREGLFIAVGRLGPTSSDCFVRGRFNVVRGLDSSRQIGFFSDPLEGKPVKEERVRPEAGRALDGGGMRA